MEEMSFGERVQLMRRRRQMTQGDLAHVLGVAQTEIHRLEAGVVKNPHADRVVALARALHVSADWLLGLEP